MVVIIFMQTVKKKNQYRMKTFFSICNRTKWKQGKMVLLKLTASNLHIIVDSSDSKLYLKKNKFKTK